MKVLVVLISLSLGLVGCGFIGGESATPPKEISLVTKSPTEVPIKSEKVSEIIELTEVPVDTPLPPTPIPTEDPLSALLRNVELEPLVQALRAGESVTEALKTVVSSPTAVPTATAVPVTEVTPTSTPISSIPTPTPTVGPSPTPTLSPTPVPTPTSTPIPTPTPIITPIPTATPLVPVKYSSVKSSEVSGIPDLLDYTAGPIVTDNVLSFSTTYAIRGSGAPTVVQLWQRNGTAEGIVSDAKEDNCKTEGPVAFFRPLPTRGMKYSETEELNYRWTYCINNYTIINSATVPWKNATTWTHSPSTDPETFVFSGSIAGFSNRFNSPGKWVIVVFSEGQILSEKVLP